MMRFAVLIAAGLWVVLALPTAMAAELPRTVEEQADWIADFWAAWLSEDCGDALPLDVIAGPRQELVQGLKDLVHGPLTIEQFWIVQRCMMGGVDRYTPRRPPLELELCRDVRTNLYNLERYLANPLPQTGKARGPSEDPSLAVSEQVSFQIAELFQLLQEGLTAQLGPIIGDRDAARNKVAGAIFMQGYQLVLPNLLSPTTRVFKRPLTSEEMENLRAHVAELVQASPDSLQERLSWFQTPREPNAQDLYHPAVLAASSLAHAIQTVYWAERPPMLSAEEQRALDEALDEALAARHSAGEPTP
jgi:hypothetical protein